MAVSLQEAARALRSCASQKPAEAPDCLHAGETRSFYFSPAAVQMKKELLRKYRADDFQGLLEKAHTLLVGFVKRMQSVYKDVRVRGRVISSLGAQLNHAAALLLRMRNSYEKIVPVHK